MSAITGCFLLMLCGYSTCVSTSSRRCWPQFYGRTFCYTKPDPPVALSWYGAMEWCKNIGATLPVDDLYYSIQNYANALSYFDMQSEIHWLGANFTYDPDNWLWADGTRFAGIIEEQYSFGKTHAYIMRNGSTVKFVAKNAYDKAHYICRIDYPESSCGRGPDTYWTNGSCYYKSSNRVGVEGYSWYEYVSQCGKADFPLYDDLKELSKWLDNSVKFWVGLRCGWWKWRNTGTGISSEMLPIDYQPNIIYGQCLVDDNHQFNWNAVNCSRTLQFVCLELETNDTTTKRITNPVSTTELHASSKASSSTFNTDWKFAGLGVRLGVGLGGGLSLAVTLYWPIFHAYF